MELSCPRRHLDAQYPVLQIEAPAMMAVVLLVVVV